MGFDFRLLISLFWVGKTAFLLKDKEEGYMQLWLCRSLVGRKFGVESIEIGFSRISYWRIKIYVCIYLGLVPCFLYAKNALCWFLEIYVFYG